MLWSYTVSPFVTSSHVAMSDHLHAQVTPSRGKGAFGIHCIEECVGPRTGLDYMQKDVSFSNFYNPSRFFRISPKMDSRTLRGMLTPGGRPLVNSFNTLMAKDIPDT
jgi:hypothetical protein